MVTCRSRSGLTVYSAWFYLYNRTVCRGTGKTPFELWNGHKPDVSNLKTFGSLAYVYVPEKRTQGGTQSLKRQKLDYRSVRGIFVAYPTSQKGWKILDCTRSKVLVSCHVTFDESESPASAELKRQGLNQLARLVKLDFNNYARTATREDQLLFYGTGNSEITPTQRDMELLDRFVRDFDMASVNVARALALLIDYASHCAARLSEGVASGPQVPPKTACSATNPILSAVERLHQAEALVALKKIADKVYMDGVAQHAVIPEPTTYEEAMRSPDAKKWRAAMADEISSIRRHTTWKECELPPGKRALRTKWIFKVKRNSDGPVQRFKARLVVVGCMQKKGIGYHELFAPVVCMESLRIVLAIVTVEDLECGQVDFDTAFWNGDCEDEVYVHQPDGIHSGEKHRVLRLRKSLYGLKQAPRAWYHKLTCFLKRHDFVKLACEPCIFVRWRKGLQLVAVYGDDVLVVAKTQHEMCGLKQTLGSEFKAKDLGDVHFMLGPEIRRDCARRRMTVKQQLCINNALVKFNLQHCNPVDTPSVQSLKLRKIERSTERLPYREAVGTLMYVMVATRADLAFGIPNASQHLNAFGEKHWAAVKRQLRYLKGTSKCGLVFGGASVTRSASISLTGLL